MSKIAKFFFLLLVFFSPNLIPAHAEDIYTEETETSWGVIASDDGFSKSFAIYKSATNFGITDFGDDITYTIEIQCESRTLDVLVYADPIGIYPTSDFNRVGYAQVKVDSGKINKYKYVALKDSSGIALWSPKILTSAILKGKKQVAFKIPSSIQNDTVANFPKADLSKYTNKFKSLGCALK